MSAAVRPPRSRAIVLRIDDDQCIGCAMCADVCPSGGLEMTAEDALPRWIESSCNGCTICARQCPTGAITVATVARATSV